MKPVRSATASMMRAIRASHAKRVLTLGWALYVAAFAVPTLEGAVWVVVLVVPHVGGEGAVWRLQRGRQRWALQVVVRTE